MRRGFFLVVLLLLLVFSSAYGYNVAVLYDVSGSVQWSEEWRAALRQVNKDILFLIGDGEIPSEDTWMLTPSPSLESEIRGSLFNPGDYLLYMEFADIESPKPPFFKNYKITDDLSEFPDPLKGWLFDGRHPPRGSLTYLDLAKWQALNLFDENWAGEDRLFIVVSDFDRDVGGKHATDDLVLQKVSEYRTQYRETALLKAHWKTQHGDKQLLGFEVFLVEPTPISPPPPPPPPDLIAKLDVYPSVATVKKGESCDFNVSASDAKGNSVKIAPTDFDWSVSGAIGTIDRAGLFQATEVGEGRIQATLIKDKSIYDTTELIRVVPSASGFGWLLLIALILLGGAVVVVIITRIIRRLRGQPVTP